MMGISGNFSTKARWFWNYDLINTGKLLRKTILQIPRDVQLSSLLIRVFLIMWDKVVFYVHYIKLNWKSNIYHVLKICSVSVTCEFFVFKLSVYYLFVYNLFVYNLFIICLSRERRENQEWWEAVVIWVQKWVWFVNVGKRTMKTNEIFQILRDVQLSSLLISAFLMWLDKTLCCVHDSRLQNWTPLFISKHVRK